MLLHAVIAAITLLPARPLDAQVVDSCLPENPQAVVDWHNQWDAVPDSMLLRVGRSLLGGTSGTFTIPDTAVPVDRTAVYGRWRLVAYLAGRASEDRRWDGTLALSGTSWRLRRRYRETEYVKHDRMLGGRLIGRRLVKLLTSEDRDDVSIVGLFDPNGGLMLEEGLYMADGGGFAVTRFTSDTLFGSWFPPGPVVPPYMGWFCAYRVK